jgi:hypothetical protein
VPDRPCSLILRTAPLSLPHISSCSWKGDIALSAPDDTSAMSENSVISISMPFIRRGNYYYLIELEMGFYPVAVALL